MTSKAKLLLLSFLLLVTSVAQGQDNLYARMPWHLIDLWWDTGSTGCLVEASRGPVGFAAGDRWLQFIKHFSPRRDG